ncbi:YheC/YheD family protein [Neobacillus sp. SCS-31]|uniref:YheC/YheD family protein n=1 Tax=Neobacillus oceani TaxID=3115292 RepID=UPI003905F8E6
MNRHPFVGICVGETAETIHDPNFKLLHIRLNSYNGKPVNFIKFTLDKLDLRNKSVTGDLWMGGNKEIPWKEGVYPLPQVIFMQCRFRKKSLEPFINKGITIFNSVFFDKIDNINFFAAHPELSPYAPETKLIKNSGEIEEFLFKREKAFLKPVNGFSGRGIVYIEKTGDGTIKANYHLNKSSEEASFPNCQELWKWINESYFQDRYVIQECIDSIRKRGMPTDIRLNMNRNEKGEWEVIRLFGRMALNGTHMGSKKGIHFFPSTLSSILSERLTKKAIENIEQKLIQLGYTICNCFEKDNEHMADLGIDFMIDQHKRIWLIEINTFPSPAGNDPSVTLPLEYARFIATGTP